VDRPQGEQDPPEALGHLAEGQSASLLLQDRIERRRPLDPRVNDVKGILIGIMPNGEGGDQIRMGELLEASC